MDARLNREMFDNLLNLYVSLHSKYRELVFAYQKQLSALESDDLQTANSTVQEKALIISEIDFINSRIEALKQRMAEASGQPSFILSGTNAPLTCAQREALELETARIRDTLDELMSLDRTLMDSYARKLEQVGAKLGDLKANRRMLAAYRQAGPCRQGGLLDIKE